MLDAYGKIRSVDFSWVRASPILRTDPARSSHVVTEAFALSRDLVKIALATLCRPQKPSLFRFGDGFQVDQASRSAPRTMIRFDATKGSGHVYDFVVLLGDIRRFCHSPTGAFHQTWWTITNVAGCTFCPAFRAPWANEVTL